MSALSRQCFNAAFRSAKPCSSSSFPCQFCHCVEPCIMCHARFSGLQTALLLGARYQLTALRCACNGELVDSMFGRQGRQALQSTAKAFALRSSHRHTLQPAQRKPGVRQSGPQSVFHLCHVSFELHTQHPLASGLCCTCPRCTCMCYHLDAKVAHFNTCILREQAASTQCPMRAE